MSLHQFLKSDNRNNLLVNGMATIRSCSLAFVPMNIDYYIVCGNENLILINNITENGKGTYRL